MICYCVDGPCAGMGFKVGGIRAGDKVTIVEHGAQYLCTGRNLDGTLRTRLRRRKPVTVKELLYVDPDYAAEQDAAELAADA